MCRTLTYVPKIENVPSTCPFHILTSILVVTTSMNQRHQVFFVLFVHSILYSSTCIVYIQLRKTEEIGLWCSRRDGEINDFFLLQCKLAHLNSGKNMNYTHLVFCLSPLHCSTQVSRKLEVYTTVLNQKT